MTFNKLANQPTMLLIDSQTLLEYLHQDRDREETFRMVCGQVRIERTEVEL